jgi:membrane-associated phospholipid phosphatase
MPATSLTPPTARRGVGEALLLAGACVFALVLTWVFAALVPATHVRDAVALYDFTRLDRHFVEVPAKVLLGLLEPEFFIVWGLVLVGIASSHGRLRVALAVALVLGLAPLSAELLKPLAAHPHAQVAPLYITSASWPSGHATAATILAWCAVLVAPPALRRMVAVLGVVFVLAVGCALLILAWHMPSDVLGGYLLATLWFALTLAALRASSPVRVAQESLPAGPAACSPGDHRSSGSDPAWPIAPSLAARARMNSMSESRLR